MLHSDTVAQYVKERDRGPARVGAHRRFSAGFVAGDAPQMRQAELSLCDGRGGQTRQLGDSPPGQGQSRLSGGAARRAGEDPPTGCRISAVSRLDQRVRGYQ